MCVKKMRSQGSHPRHLSVPLKSDALTIEPSKLQKYMAQTQQFKPKLQGFLNCAAPLRLGVMALAICFDSSPKKFLCILFT